MKRLCSVILCLMISMLFFSIKTSFAKNFPLYRYGENQFVKEVSYWGSNINLKFGKGVYKTEKSKAGILRFYEFQFGSDNMNNLALGIKKDNIIDEIIISFPIQGKKTKEGMSTIGQGMSALICTLYTIGFKESEIESFLQTVQQDLKNAGNRDYYEKNYKLSRNVLGDQIDIEMFIEESQVIYWIE